MKTKKQFIGTIMAFSEGTVKTREIYAGTIHDDLIKMTENGFKKKYNKTKKEFKRLDKLYGIDHPDTPAIGTVPWDDLTPEQRENVRKAMHEKIEPSVPEWHE